LGRLPAVARIDHEDQLLGGAVAALCGSRHALRTAWHASCERSLDSETTWMKETMPRKKKPTAVSPHRTASLAWLLLALPCVALAQAQGAAQPAGTAATNVTEPAAVLASAAAAADSPLNAAGAAGGPVGSELPLENIVVSARKREEKLQDVPPGHQQHSRQRSRARWRLQHPGPVGQASQHLHRAEQSAPDQHPDSRHRQEFGQ
jgi:hypothetical protein